MLDVAAAAVPFKGLAWDAAGAWKGAMGTPKAHGLGIHGAGCAPNPGTACCAGGAAGALAAGGTLDGIFGARRWRSWLGQVLP